MRFFLQRRPNIPMIIESSASAVRSCSSAVQAYYAAGLPALKLTNRIIKSLASADITRLSPVRARSRGGNPNLSRPFRSDHWPISELWRVAVEAEVAKHLRTSRKAIVQSTSSIGSDSRKNAAGQSAIDYTNFDRLSSKPAGKKLKYFVPPVLPDLDMDHPFDGVVYLIWSIDHSAIRTRSHLGLILVLQISARIPRRRWATAS